MIPLRPGPRGASRPRGHPLLALALAALLGLAAGGGVGILVRGPARPAALQIREGRPRPPVRPVRPRTLLVWTPGGLPPGLGRKVARLRGVEHVVSVVSGVAWLTASADEAGTPVDRPPAGLAIPLEVAGAAPRAYGPFLPPADRALLPGLERGEAVLGSSSADLRRLGTGAVLWFGPHRVRVAGILPDAEVGAHEVLVSRRVARALGVRTDRYLLIDPAPGTSRRQLTAAIRSLLPPGFLLRVRGPGETPYFRQGDAVLPPVRLKQLFGEFAARPRPGGYLRIDPRWERTHIVTATVPLLGRVRCNRAIVPPLRAALAEAQREGLAGDLPAGAYAGCYAPRFLNRDPTSGLSHHAWGVAIDLNPFVNRYGHTPHQDPRLVAVFERWGFTWGGRWLLPDGMHFEFVQFPTGR